MVDEYLIEEVRYSVTIHQAQIKAVCLFNGTPHLAPIDVWVDTRTMACPIAPDCGA